MMTGSSVRLKEELGLSDPVRGEAERSEADGTISAVYEDRF